VGSDGRELLWAVCDLKGRGRGHPMGECEGAIEVFNDPSRQLFGNRRRRPRGGHVRRFSSLISDKARGNVRDGGVARHSCNYSPVIWQGRLGNAAKDRLNTLRYPREDSCALSP
jgi:hypothetical protein